MGNIFLKDDVRTEFEDLKSDLNEGNIPEAAAEYRGYLNEMQNLPLNIAVVGKAGAGKSSFINAFWGINEDEDYEAAKVWTLEESKVPKPYPHPSSPNITIWELPEIRERNSKAAEYFKKVQFERYDVFIMVVTDRFTENDAFLATEIQRMRKKFYCMRSKMDISIESERRKRNFSMEKTLETIRNYCEDNLRESAKLPVRVFLVSNLHAHMYEFPLLREKMATELPDYKKHIFTLAAQVFSEDNFMDKKIKMKPCIKYLAFISCVCGAVPVVGLSLACDIGIVMVALKCFWKVLGIDQRSLRFLALQTGKGFEELRSEMKKRPLVKTISAQLALSLLMKSALWVRPLSMALYVTVSFIGSHCLLLQGHSHMPLHHTAPKHPNVSFPFQIISTEQRATMGNLVLKDFVRREFEDLKSDLNKGNIPKVAMRCWKSSFVNAIRGVKDDDEEASMVDAIEGTMEPKPYPHPSFPNIKIWDLPNRTPKFQAKEYLKKVNFERYDIFIMVISERFTENNAFLAKEIQRMKKKLYYVRSKMDISVQNEKRNKNFNMEETLKSIRNYCQDSLKSTGVPSPRVFLISSREAYKYDFPLLKETIAVELPDHKKDILTLSVHIFSEKELMKKKELMKAYIKKIADILCLWSRSCPRSLDELRSEIKKRPLVKTISAQLALSLLMKSALWVRPLSVKYLGMVFGGVSSFFVTYCFLNKFLDNAVENARKVRTKLLK
uniref:IRG-type G domain-containing protein n=1 Tax=Naja naja TaxID=35670 RepID=A0A8C6XRY4_NAJNA